MNLLVSLQNRLRNEAIDRVMDAANKPVGSMQYDPWGYSREVSKLAFALFRPIYDHYFRVSAEGLENIPAEGPCLIIANHSGSCPMMRPCWVMRWGPIRMALGHRER